MIILHILMNRRLKRIIRYIYMSLLLIVLALPVLYFAGAPLASYLWSQGEMIIIKGAPGYPYTLDDPDSDLQGKGNQQNNQDKGNQEGNLQDNTQDIGNSQNNLQNNSQSKTQESAQSNPDSNSQFQDLFGPKNPDGSSIKPGEADIPDLGSQYGTIHCDRIGLSVPLYYGDDDKVLQKGAGQYPLSGLPGEGRTILISGHDITFFAPLEDMIEGDLVRILTDYGSFDYEVTDIRITDDSDSSAYDLDSDLEQLIIYTCYPFGRLIGENDGRIFYYCSPAINE